MVSYPEFSKGHALKHKRIWRSLVPNCLRMEKEKPSWDTHVWSQLPRQREQRQTITEFPHPSLPVILCIHTQAPRWEQQQMPAQQAFSASPFSKGSLQGSITQLVQTHSAKSHCRILAPVRLTLIQEIRNCFWEWDDQEKDSEVGAEKNLSMSNNQSLVVRDMGTREFSSQWRLNTHAHVCYLLSEWCQK